MALRATIYKLELHIADMRRSYYDSHTLTLARHPSETDDRMMLRVLAFALFAGEGLVFTRGLSTTEEPSLWQKDLTGAIQKWVELGHPDERRLLQAAGKSEQVIVLCYGGHASKVWWRGVQAGAGRLRNLTVLSVDPADAKILGSYAQRQMTLHLTMDEDGMLVSSATDSLRLTLEDWSPGQENAPR